MSYNFLEEKVEQVFKIFFNENVDARLGANMRVDRGRIGIDNFNIYEKNGYWGIYNKDKKIYIYILFKSVDEALVKHDPKERPSFYDNIIAFKRREIHISKKYKTNTNHEYFIGDGVVIKSTDEYIHWGVIGDDFNCFHKKEKKIRT